MPDILDSTQDASGAPTGNAAGNPPTTGGDPSADSASLQPNAVSNDPSEGAPLPDVQTPEPSLAGTDHASLQPSEPVPAPVEGVETQQAGDNLIIPAAEETPIPSGAPTEELPTPAEPAPEHSDSPKPKKKISTAIAAVILLLFITLPVAVLFVSQQKQIADDRSRAAGGLYPPCSACNPQTMNSQEFDACQNQCIPPSRTPAPSPICASGKACPEGFSCTGSAVPGTGGSFSSRYCEKLSDPCAQVCAGNPLDESCRACRANPPSVTPRCSGTISCNPTQHAVCSEGRWSCVDNLLTPTSSPTRTPTIDPCRQVCTGDPSDEGCRACRANPPTTTTTPRGSCSAPNVFYNGRCIPPLNACREQCIREASSPDRADDCMARRCIGTTPPTCGSYTYLVDGVCRGATYICTQNCLKESVSPDRADECVARRCTGAGATYCAPGFVWDTNAGRCNAAPTQPSCSNITSGGAFTGSGFDNSRLPAGCKVYHYACPWNNQPGRSCDDRGNGALIGTGGTQNLSQNCGTEQIDIQCPASVCAGADLTQITNPNTVNDLYQKLWYSKSYSQPCAGGGGGNPPSTPIPSQPPRSTPTPTLVISQCNSIKIYKNGQVVTNPATLRPGDQVVLAVAGGNATKGRIRVNGGTWTETTTKNSAAEYIVNYTIPQSVTRFVIEAEIYGRDNIWH